MTLQTAVLAAAVAAHESNRAYCQAIGDDSQSHWEDAPDWQRTSAHKGVYAVLNNPDITPEQSHESWMAEKRNDGWVHDTVKDVEKKTHPAMLPYQFLPEEQKGKDAIFGAVVRAALTALMPGWEKVSGNGKLSS